ncbi:MAG: hypothetical protein KatS3mg131_1882 [Candidatus Tectimicrobiota bacterium]|nr:MAG: hypothetical protein KatS3mg131_1882 [Candidatus Tectomicrobia bacterium]
MDIQGDAPATGVAALVAAFRRFATFSYTVSNATHTATTSPGPGDGWGRPTLGATATDPSTCTAYNIVHYDTQGTMVTLSEGVSGCGILLVEGNLQISGAFTWYGLVLVTGSVAFTAGEIEAKQIRGAVLAAGTIPNSIGLNAHLIYCSSAVDTRNLPLRTLHWREL